MSLEERRHTVNWTAACLFTALVSCVTVLPCMSTPAFVVFTENSRDSVKREVLIAVYVTFGIGFFHHPGTDPPNPLIALPADLAQP